MGGATWLSIFGFGKAPTRKHIRPAVAGRPRSNATKAKKPRQPVGQKHFAASGGVACSLQTQEGYARRSRLASHHKLLLRGPLLFARWLLSALSGIISTG